MFKLKQGNCLEIMPQIPSGSVDMILCDLPYGTTACKWDTVIPFEPLWAEYKRIIKKNGAIVLFGSQPFTSALVASNFEMFKDSIVWDKRSPVGHLNCHVMPLRRHEDIVIFGNGRITYNPQMRTGELKKKGGYGHLDRRQVYGAHGENKPVSINDQYFPTSIVEFPGTTRNLHPTEKPLALMEYLIRTYTNAGDRVLDFTCGSGTTLRAAKNLGRRAVGIEMLEQYCQVTVNRLSPQFEAAIVAPDVALDDLPMFAPLGAAD